MEQPQTCLGLDLFEIVAELTGLDLEDAGHAAEALELSDSAQHQLADARGGPPAAINHALEEDDPPPNARFRAD